MSALSLSGTVDILFAAWEVVGISSFLLIAFYRHRSSTVRNALTAYSVYRVCDVGVLLGAWLGFHIWHRNQYFSELAQMMGASGLLHGPAIEILSLLILLAAAGKSAQFPFSFWLPRAMEGPTPSSAIFYGALSIHAGVFLLLRTFPIWHSSLLTSTAVAVVGARTTQVLSSLSSRAQSNIKGQIAYASITQVGLMLIELSFGLTNLVLVHFVANAGLRCYQLLVSPSVVAQVLRLQSKASGLPRVSDWSLERFLPNRLRSTLYVIAMQEGYLYDAIRAFVLTPFQTLGHRVNDFDRRLKGALGVVVLAIVLILSLQGWGAALVSVCMLGASLAAFSGERVAGRIWNSVGISCLLGGCSVWLLEGSPSKDVNVYLLGTSIPWIVGVFVLRALPQKGRRRVDDFMEAVDAQPGLSLLFFLCCLGLGFFPIGILAFIGEDALLHHAVESLWLAGGLTLCFVLNGISLVRLYSELCQAPRHRPRARFQRRCLFTPNFK